MKLFVKKPDIRLEKMRYQSQCQRILLTLKRSTPGTVTTNDLRRIAANYTMRVSELRKDGHKILADYVKPGVHAYYYMGRRDDDETV